MKLNDKGGIPSPTGSPSPWRMATCLGNGNLAKAVDELDRNGYEVKFVLFTGTVQMEKSNLVGPNQIDIVPTFTVIARSHDA